MKTRRSQIRMLLTILSLFLFSSCVSIRLPQFITVASFMELGAPEIEIHYLITKDFPVRVIETTDERDTQILIIHGAMSSLNGAREYFDSPELRARGQLISYDRPGYGYSNYGKPVTDVQKQAEIARSLVKPGAIIVGYSYGGTVALRMAMDYPDDFKAVIIIAGAMDSDIEAPWWINKFIDQPAVNWLVGNTWKTSNAEKLQSNYELHKMDALWNQIKVPILFIHGDRDFIIDYENSLHAMEILPENQASMITIHGGGHFIFWSHMDEIIDDIVQFIDHLPDPAIRDINTRVAPNQPPPEEQNPPS